VEAGAGVEAGVEEREGLQALALALTQALGSRSRLPVLQRGQPPSQHPIFLQTIQTEAAVRAPELRRRGWWPHLHQLAFLQAPGARSMSACRWRPL